VGRDGGRGRAAGAGGARAWGRAAGCEARAGMGPSRRGRMTGKKKGEGEGKREKERERGAHLGVQIRQSPSPRPRAPPWGERDGREREVATREKSNERKRTGEGGHAWGAGGARGARAELGRARLGWAGPHCGSKSHGTHNHRSEIKRETESETRLSDARD
jgi:hypothetical protein